MSGRQGGGGYKGIAWWRSFGGWTNSRPRLWWWLCKSQYGIKLHRIIHVEIHTHTYRNVWKNSKKTEQDLSNYTTVNFVGLMWTIGRQCYHWEMLKGMRGFLHCFHSLLWVYKDSKIRCFLKPHICQLYRLGCFRLQVAENSDSIGLKE